MLSTQYLNRLRIHFWRTNLKFVSAVHFTTHHTVCCIQCIWLAGAGAMKSWNSECSFWKVVSSKCIHCSTTMLADLPGQKETRRICYITFPRPRLFCEYCAKTSIASLPPASQRWSTDTLRKLGLCPLLLVTVGQDGSRDRGNLPLQTSRQVNASARTHHSISLPWPGHA